MVSRQGVFIGLGSESLEGLVALVSSVSSEAIKLKSSVSLTSSESDTLACCQEQFQMRHWVCSQKEA
jgi:hypothetical protein